MTTPGPFGPGATLGLLGGGQLGRMLGMAARSLGYGVVVWAGENKAPAAAIADQVLTQPHGDLEGTIELMRKCDLITLEWENVPADTVAVLAEHRPCHPSASVLRITQDRLEERALIESLGIPTAPAAGVRSAHDLAEASQTLGFPARLKTARGGYDGGGQWRIRRASDLVSVPTMDGTTRYRWEKEVAFEREISVILARSSTGEVRLFPIFENEHKDGILHLTRCPARISPEVARLAESIARRIAEALQIVGTLTVECFVVPRSAAAGGAPGGHDVWVNELAPRVHNSGHLTIEACATSQFEQHIRAICGLPLGETALRGPAAMVNLLGDQVRAPTRLTGAPAALAVPDAHLHLYGKQGVRPRRKMGHVTALAETLDGAVERALKAHAALGFA